MLNRKVIIFLFIMLVVCTARIWAGIFLLHPQAGPQEQVWYNCQFSTKGTEDKFFLKLSTTGYVLPYINGRIATRSSIWPSRPNNVQGVASEELDVTNLVKPGKNTIALWYAPISGLEEEPDGQVSVELYYVKGKRKVSLCNNDSKWMVHLAPAYTWKYGEDYDATAPYLSDWKTRTTFGIDWTPAEKGMMPEGILTIPNRDLYPCNMVFPDKSIKTDSINTYFYPKTVTGQLRITIRGAKKGDKLDINSMTYTCRGVTDEQFFTRFSTITTNTVEIKPEIGKKLPKIMGIAIIELKERDR